jgi:hypothetical protein
VEAFGYAAFSGDLGLRWGCQFCPSDSSRFSGVGWLGVRKLPDRNAYLAGFVPNSRHSRHLLAFAVQQAKRVQLDVQLCGLNYALGRSVTGLPVGAVSVPFWLACIIGCQIGSALADMPKRDPRLAKRPTVLATRCGSPSPYYIENWNSDALEFVVVLKEGIPASTAHMLAVKHNFEINGAPGGLGPRAKFKRSLARTCPGCRSEM